MTDSTYWRLEHGKIDDPRLSWLVNIAAFFDVALSEIIEDEWLSGTSRRR